MSHEQREEKWVTCLKRFRLSFRILLPGGWRRNLNFREIFTGHDAGMGERLFVAAKK